MLHHLKTSKTIGGILLVAGTTIGAGMLALPVITSFAGFIPSILIFVFCWLLMLISAFCFLDVNLAIRGENNMITMAQKTLGNVGKWVSWVTYLALLYALTAAYIEGSVPFFQEGIASLFNISISEEAARFILPLFFGSFVWFGTRGIDYLNRLLMVGLFLAYGLLIYFLPSHIQFERLSVYNFPKMYLALPIIITSFGYHIIIPSLTTYLDHDVKKLRQVLLIGSCIPIVFYLIWQFLVIGSVPAPMLQQALHDGLSAAAPLISIISTPVIRVAVTLFSFFAIITSFLGISLSLSAFLSDGLKLKKCWQGKLSAYLLTFIPPLTFVFTYTKGFYIALEYGGIFVSILLILLPALMALRLKKNPFYQKLKGKVFLGVVIFFAILIIAIDVLSKCKLINYT